ncbi:MAG: carbonic anhydrase [Verrucomicrobiales bacterium]|nr:carbonic anhydrase [Verrucomicrobiales bacterium]
MNKKLIAVVAGTCAVVAVPLLLLGENLPVSADEQKKLTPKEVLDELMAGNKRYVEGKVSEPNIKARIEASSSGQYPKAVILSCLDSRVPVELVFDQGIGDVFVGRVAGNVENEDLLGSMEFATKAAGAKLVMVLGHEACGAVKGACDKVEMGNLTGLLKKIEPAVKAVEGFAEAERTSKNHDFVEKVIEQNVRQTVSDIRTSSPILAEMEKKGEILIVGGLYSLEDGSVKLLE